MSTCGKPVAWWTGGVQGEQPCALKPAHVGTCTPLTCPEQHDWGDPAVSTDAPCSLCLRDRLDALEALVRPMFEVHGVPVRPPPPRRWLRPLAWLRLCLHHTCVCLDDLARTS